MKVISVNASRKYDVIIGSGLLPALGRYVNDLKKAGKAAIISDSNVWPYYGSIAEQSLQSAGFETFSYVFPAGESSKTAETYLSILNFLAQNQFTRSDVIIALGGGVVGDMAGFAASTYLRGVTYIQVPTSLLAMVDSSVGGKTAIDLPAGKNLVGAFYQPSLVLCDTDTLNTLPAEIFRDGCAEVIKYGILYDSTLFDYLSATGLSFDREGVISRCVVLKADAVNADEFDTGARQKLNLGHTIGHSIEALSSFTVSHGQAVAIGTAIITKAAEKNSFCNHTVTDRVLEALHKFSLPTCTNYSAEELYTHALSDKKRSRGAVNLIIPREIGNCTIQSMPVSNLQTFIETGL